MCRQVLEFKLTDHFMQQGWDRSIDQIILFKLLRYVKATKASKKVVVVTPSFYTSKEIVGKPNHCLVLILKEKIIITGFWCDHPNYLFRKEKEAEFELLYA